MSPSPSPSPAPSTAVVGYLTALRAFFTSGSLAHWLSVIAAAFLSGAVGALARTMEDGPPPATLLQWKTIAVCALTGGAIAVWHLAFPQPTPATPSGGAQ